MKMNRITVDEFMVEAEKLRGKAFTSLEEGESAIKSLRENAPEGYSVWNVNYEKRDLNNSETIYIPEYDYGKDKYEIVLHRDKNLLKEVSPIFWNEDPIQLVELYWDLKGSATVEYRKPEEFVWGFLHPEDEFTWDAWDREVNFNIACLSSEEKENIYNDYLASDEGREYIRTKASDALSDSLEEVFDYAGEVGGYKLSNFLENVVDHCEDLKDDFLEDEWEYWADLAIAEFSESSEEEQIGILLSICEKNPEMLFPVYEKMCEKLNEEYLILPLVSEIENGKIASLTWTEGVWLTNPSEGKWHNPLDELNKYEGFLIAKSSNRFATNYIEDSSKADVVVNDLACYLNNDLWSTDFVKNDEIIDRHVGRGENPDKILLKERDNLLQYDTLADFVDLICKNKYKVI